MPSSNKPTLQPSSLASSKKPAAVRPSTSKEGKERAVLFQEDEYIEDTNSNYEEYNTSAKNYSFSSVNEDRVSYSTSGDHNSSADEEEVQADASDQIHADIRSSKKDKDADDMLDLMDNNCEVDEDSLEVEEKNDEQDSNAEDDMMGKAIFTTSSRKPHPNAKIGNHIDE